MDPVIEDTSITKLPEADRKERENPLGVWHGEKMDLGPRSLGGHIARWARRSPNAPALVCGEECLSYQQLDSRANQLAHWLQAQGVKAGELVALEMPRSPDLIAAMLATWRIGAAYLPLEPGWPAARREQVLTDARPALLLGSVPYPLDSYSAEPLHHRPRAEDRAYVLYTSGSTGRPKGVVIGQRQLLNYVTAASAEMQLESCRRWGLVTSPATDLGNTALFGALFNGACLVMAREDETRSPTAFARFINEREIDALKVVPSHLAALLDCDTPQLPDTLILGGEATPRALVERIFQLAPDCTVYNHYGPTEATVGVMVHRVDPAEPVPETLPLSRVLANNSIHLLDREMRPVPTGELGEIYIGGAQLCQGYLGQGYLGRNLNGSGNDSVFVQHSGQIGQRLYRSGDLARALPEGLCLAGRVDQQIKVRGYRVEPAEVEAALLALPGVQQAALVTRGADQTKEAGAVDLIAFVVTNSDREPPHWRDQLSERLPSHMLPAELIAIDAIPRLSSGKVDLLALEAKAISEQSSREQDGGAEPASALEATLCELMARLLDREQMAADADFFESGGHSLLVIRLVARIRKVFQIEVEPGLVFDHATPRALAQAICAEGDAVALEQLAQEQGTGYE